MSDIKLDVYINIKEPDLSSRLVKSEAEITAVPIQDFVPEDQINLRIFIVDGDGNFAGYSGSASYAVVAGLGTPGGTRVAFTDTFSTITNGWEGILDLATDELETAIGTAESKTFFFEVQVTDEDGKVKTILQIPVLVRNEVNDEASTSPTPTPSYYTKAEVDAIFAALSDAFVYIAYADANDGTGFSLSDYTKDFIAIKTSTTEIVSPGAGNFAGLWHYWGGGHVYIGYASADDGTGFSTTWSEGLNFISFVSSRTPLTPVVGDFSTWIKFTGTKRWRQMHFGAGGIIPNQTNGPAFATVEVGANKVMMDVLYFDPDTEESAQKPFTLPDIYDLGKIKVKIYWTPQSGATPGDKVVFGLRATAAGDGNNINDSFGTEVTIQDTVLAAGQLHVTAASAAITINHSPALGDMIWLKISRKAADGDDTCDVDAGILAVVVGWKESATEPAVW